MLCLLIQEFAQSRVILPQSLALVHDARQFLRKGLEVFHGAPYTFSDCVLGSSRRCQGPPGSHAPAASRPPTAGAIRNSQITSFTMAKSSGAARLLFRRNARH